MVYQLVGLHLVGIIFHILTGSCHTYITGSCKKLYNKLHCLHCLLITTQTNNIAPVYDLWFTITTLLLQLYVYPEARLLLIINPRCRMVYKSEVHAS